MKMMFLSMKFMLGNLGVGMKGFMLMTEQSDPMNLLN